MMCFLDYVGFVRFPGQLYPWQTSQAFYLYIQLT